MAYLGAISEVVLYCLFAIIIFGFAAAILLYRKQTQRNTVNIKEHEILRHEIQIGDKKLEVRITALEDK